MVIFNRINLIVGDYYLIIFLFFTEKYFNCDYYHSISM